MSAPIWKLPVSKLTEPATKLIVTPTAGDTVKKLLRLATSMRVPTGIGTDALVGNVIVVPSREINSLPASLACKV